MKTARTAVAALFALIAAVSFTPRNVSAMVGGDGALPGGGQLKKMAAELGLSDQQKQDLKDVFAKNRPLTEPLMKLHKTERRALRTLIQADSINETAIRTQAAKVAAVEADLAVQRAQMAQQIRAILTPEQVQKFKDLQAQRDSKMDAAAAARGTKHPKPGN